MISWILTQQYTWKDLCMEKSTLSPDKNIKIYNFQSVLHDDANIWADAGSLKR